MTRLMSTRARFVGSLVLALALIASVGFVLPADRVLVVERTDTGETVISQSVTNGTTVAIEYTHSVEKSRVYDGYTVRGDKLVMTRMEFESYGWGLPAGANVTRQNGTFVFDPPGTYEELYVSPGETAGHKLHVDDRTYDLVERSGGQSVRIHLEHRTVFDRLL